MTVETGSVKTSYELSVKGVSNPREPNFEIDVQPILTRLGCNSGLMTQSDNADPAITPPAGDRRTAEAFGEHIARCTLRWVRGAA